MKKVTSSAEQTKQFAKDLGRHLKGGEVLTLSGELGSGKTTFIQGLAMGLGIKQTVTSPTFILRRSYRGLLQLEHFDFYRLESSEDLKAFDLPEIVGQEGIVTVIEWPEKVGFNWKGEHRLSLKYISENKREITYETLP